MGKKRPNWLGTSGHIWVPNVSGPGVQHGKINWVWMVPAGYQTSVERKLLNWLDTNGPQAGHKSTGYEMFVSKKRLVKALKPRRTFTTMAGFFCERNLWSDDWSEGGDWSEQCIHPVYMAFSLVHSPCEIWVRVTKKAHFWWFHGSWRRPGLTELILERPLPTVFYIGRHSNTGDLVSFYMKSANTAFLHNSRRACSRWPRWCSFAFFQLNLSSVVL